MELKFDVDENCKHCFKELKKLADFMDSIKEENTNTLENYNKMQKKIIFTPDLNVDGILTNWHITVEDM